MDSTLIARRMEAILDELSQHEQFEDCFPVLEADDESGAVKLTITRNPLKTKDRYIMSKTICFDEDLSRLRELFDYPNIITSRNVDIEPRGIKMAYIDSFGNLVTEREDTYHGSTEVFKIKSGQREAVIEKLKKILGKKLKA